MRPRTLDEVVGQKHLTAPGRLLHELVKSGRLPSLILWGPPGCGKTTLAAVLARLADAHFAPFSAVMGGVKELRALIDEARTRLSASGRRTILFVDEIHRFNKSQQDAFLPHVEDGTVTLIGATTENPSFEVVAPLLSRARVVLLQPLEHIDIVELLRRALGDGERGLGTLSVDASEEVLAFLADAGGGDARAALNLLETAAELAAAGGHATIDIVLAQEAAQHRALRHDKSGEEHYNLVSAFIKSLRDSDPDGALYWMLRMLEAGEDPMFVARRMVIFASEDVGNADPRGLQVAVAAKDAVHFVGLPEGRIPLAQAATYLATAPKSNASYKAMLAAAQDARSGGNLPVPMHLRNAPTAMMKGIGYGKGYRYAHDYAENVVEQQHLPDELRDRVYYHPSNNGDERAIRERLTRWREVLKQRSKGKDQP